ncbi:hypothetical protein [Paraburkholderia acidiphila]|uniref:Alpha/beta hydrolase family protein DUF900 n=1 Tax=Paraburkholderia acidiphila TaxID=2571747 RepID=A0A7Z2GBB8_9BURK|nr:hypothetical protein [Paraburkholderia acidiphila]QGZ58653.1 hypothetical protein FAZ97_27130 [Paraburkholderia acidiphila]
MFQLPKKIISLSVFAFVFAGCSSNPPYHAYKNHAPDKSACERLYDAFDKTLTDTGTTPAASKPTACGTLERVDPDGDGLSKCLSDDVDQTTPGGADNACWHTPAEHHKNYDLFFTEFDDQGWEADLRANPKLPANTTEIENLFAQLDALVSPPKPANPTEPVKPVRLDIVVYTHGWHGSSQSDNYYAVLFRAFLESLAKFDAPPAEERHVVGIFIGWRGDSLTGPLKYATVLDRKLAAETVSAGAVQGLFERLHKFYVDNSCHPSGNTETAGSAQHCGNVHMLTIGHSFGALVDFRSLLGNMETGLNTKQSNRVYSFGDLVVLLNPAFEGTRYAPLFYSAQRRAYIQPGEMVGGVQLPVLVTLQSDGDWATRDMFPIFRHVTAAADNSLDAEGAEDDHGAGWVPAFQTHLLCLSPQATSPNYPTSSARPESLCGAANLIDKDECETGSNAGKPLMARIDCRIEQCWARSGNPTREFEIFNDPSVYMGDGMSLVKVKVPTASADPSINYFPYWVVRVDKAIMMDHNDIWNPLTTALILELYHAVVAQADLQAKEIKGERAGAKSVATDSNKFQKISYAELARRKLPDSHDAGKHELVPKPGAESQNERGQ